MKLDGIWKNKHYGLLVRLREKKSLGYLLPGRFDFGATMWILKGDVTTDEQLQHIFLTSVLPSQRVRIQVSAVYLLDNARMGEPTFAGTIWDIDGLLFGRYDAVLHRPR